MALSDLFDLTPLHQAARDVHDSEKREDGGAEEVEFRLATSSGAHFDGNLEDASACIVRQKKELARILEFMGVGASKEVGDAPGVGTEPRGNIGNGHANDAGREY